MSSFVGMDLYEKNLNALKMYIEETRKMIRDSDAVSNHLTTRVKQLEDERDALKSQVQNLLVKVYSQGTTSEG